MWTISIPRSPKRAALRRKPPGPPRRTPALRSARGKPTRACAATRRGQQPRATMTEPVLFSAAPVFQVDGQVKGDIARDLLRLEVEETTAGLRTLVMRL